jgi:hypothetical protein
MEGRVASRRSAGDIQRSGIRAPILVSFAATLAVAVTGWLICISTPLCAVIHMGAAPLEGLDSGGAGYDAAGVARLVDALLFLGQVEFEVGVEVPVGAYGS